MSECDRCGREIATAEDLERWKAEGPRLLLLPVRRIYLPPDIALRHGELPLASDPGNEIGGLEDSIPGWALALCWAEPHRCTRSRRWASETHIGEARRVFADWAGEGADRSTLTVFIDGKVVLQREIHSLRIS